MHTNRQVTNEKQIPIRSFTMLISIGSLHHKHLNCVHYPKSLNAQTSYAISLEITNEWKEPRENLWQQHELGCAELYTAIDRFGIMLTKIVQFLVRYTVLQLPFAATTIEFR